MKRSNGVYFGVLKTIVSRTLYSQLTSIKTDIIIDTLAMIFPSRSQLASKQIRRTGRAEAVTKEGLAATLLPGREPDQMGQRHSLRPVRPRGARSAPRRVKKGICRWGRDCHAESRLSSPAGRAGMGTGEEPLRRRFCRGGRLWRGVLDLSSL